MWGLHQEEEVRNTGAARLPKWGGGGAGTRLLWHSVALLITCV